jgi:diguanylate cyclase
MLRLLHTLWPSSKQLPDVVFVELVAMLYTTLMPNVIVGVTVFGVGSLVAAREGDAAAFALTLACVVTAIGRVIVVLSYRRATVGSALTIQEARLWEGRFAKGSYLFAILLGTLSARTLLMDDPLISMLITCLVFGYGSGLSVRQAVRPTICIPSLFLVTLPVIVSFGIEVGAATGPSNIAIYVAQTLLVVGFALTSFMSISHGYQTTLQQLLVQRDLAVLAGNDALTGLPNRTQLRSRFNESVVRMRKTGEILAFHCMDLDRFKPVNDTFGHPMGDALLKAVAARLARTVKAEDTAARLGGDEFVVVQTGIRHMDEARLLAQRIIRTLGEPYVIDGREIQVGVSVGIALSPRDGTDLEQITARADIALYQAKREARGSALFCDDAAGPAATETGKWRAFRRLDSGHGKKP